MSLSLPLDCAVLPPPLRQGGTIGIVSPSRWADPAWIEAAKNYFESNGFKVFIHPQNNLKEHRLAGSDAARAAAVMDLFLDPSIDAILCARGGSGAIRMVDLLDFDAIRQHPKPLIGFSDITVLLNAIRARAGIVTYHGPLGWNFAQPDSDPRVGPDLLAALTQSTAPRHFDDIEVERPGAVEGTLIGGNLRLLQSLVATPYDWKLKDSILFIEDTSEEFYSLDRTMAHLRLAGYFETARAVLVGEMVDVHDDPEGPYGRDVRRIILDHVPPNIPLAFNVPCGHGKYLTTFPVGARVRLSLAPGKMDLTLLS